MWDKDARVESGSSVKCEELMSKCVLGKYEEVVVARNDTGSE